MRELVVYIDVDDTLVRSFGSKRIPMTPVLERIRALWAEGVVLYCWSSGGGEYARNSARELGIEECFAGFLPKPHVAIDDVPLERWPELVQLHPNQALDVDEAALRNKLGWRDG